MCVIIYPVLSRSDKSNWLASQEEVCTIFAYEEQWLIEYIPINLINDTGCAIIIELFLKFFTLGN